MTRRGRRLVATLVGAATLLSLAPGAVEATEPAKPGGLLPAAIAGDFDPGNIISDTVFFDPGAMTANQVQAFLSAKGANCVPGEQPCLKDYVTTTVAKAADAYCQGYVGGRAESAAQIITGVAASCGVNPRVLLVVLEKEQPLVTRTRPTTYAYERATGFGCPDSAPCNSQYFGLFNQVYLSARQYQRYADPSYATAYRAGRTVNILYNPDAARCGSSPVYIRTPIQHQRNISTLSNSSLPESARRISPAASPC